MQISAINPTLEFKWLPKRNIAAADLDAVQSAIGVRFPPDYREFLQLGGRLVVGNFIGAKTDAIKVGYDLGDGLRYVQRWVGVVYDLDSAMRHHRIFTEDMGAAEYEDGEVVREIHARLPPFMFPIAHDNGSGWCLLDLSERGHGTVWYWQRVDITFGEEGNMMFGRVAPDFTAFLAAIRDEAAVLQEVTPGATGAG